MALLARITDFVASATIDPDVVDQELGQLVSRLNAMPSEALKPTVGRAAANADLTLSTSPQDVPGASVTITPVVASKLLVVAQWDLECQSAPTGTLDLCRGSIVEGGHAYPSTVNPGVGFTAPSTSVLQWRLPLVAVASVPLAAGVAQTVKLQAWKGSTLGTCICRQNGSGFTYNLVAS